MFDAADFVTEQCFIVVKGRWLDSVGPERLICVYAPMDCTERKSFFDYLSRFLMQWDYHNLGGYMVKKMYVREGL